MLRAARDPAVDRVQDEGDDRERHQTSSPAPGRSNESATSAATPPTSVARARVTRSAGPSSPAVPWRARPRASAAYGRHPAGDADDPAGAAEADRRGERGEQRQLGDQPDHRAGLNRTHRASVCMGYSR